MSRWRALAERLLRGCAADLSPTRRSWAAAMLGELQAIEAPGAALRWMLGVAGVILGTYLGQALLPWRRAAGERPPARFSALLGVVLLAAPAWYALGGGAPMAALTVLAGAAAMLSLWINAGAVLRAQPLGGLHYAVAIRLLPVNIAVAMLAVATGVALV